MNRDPRTAEFFTTGMLGALIGVAPATAARWVDRQGLKAHLMPDSRRRRVLRADLVRWLREHRYDYAMEAMGERTDETV